MTATPIPRSLTLTMFGDMSVSQLKTKPRNRLPIITSAISSEKRFEVITSLNKKLQLGEKIYWVCPLIDQSDETLKTIFSEEENPYLSLFSDKKTENLTKPKIRGKRKFEIFYFSKKKFAEIKENII